MSVSRQMSRSDPKHKPTSRAEMARGFDRAHSVWGQNPKLTEALIRMVNEGLSSVEIANQLGLDVQQVGHKARALGLTLANSGRLGRPPKRPKDTSPVRSFSWESALKSTPNG